MATTTFKASIPASTPVEYSPDGQVALSMLTGGPRGGGVIVPDDGSETIISTDSDQTPQAIVKMTGLKLICLTAPTANVVAEVKDYVTIPPAPPNPGRVPVTLLKVDMLTAYAIGKEIDFRFDAPLSSFKIASDPTRPGIIMVIPAGGGTWRAYLTGYLLDPSTIPPTG